MPRSGVPLTEITTLSILDLDLILIFIGHSLLEAVAMNSSQVMFGISLLWPSSSTHKVGV